MAEYYFKAIHNRILMLSLDFSLTVVPFLTFLLMSQLELKEKKDSKNEDNKQQTWLRSAKEKNKFT